ncbi:hypothetical protein Y032_0036g3229 [Ancylostoma ceylanicum]|uniref:Secreted protein n=1 Tax=Ancylostoma ceylanicum TaxID=53326 RepID=A0A016UK88_9BILA|nr:hypothetical protein Y032_0036g3229 [Ancylostoma ceylanicum]
MLEMLVILVLFLCSTKGGGAIQTRAHSSSAALFNVRIQPPPQPDRNRRGQKLVDGRSYARVCMDGTNE